MGRAARLQKSELRLMTSRELINPHVAAISQHQGLRRLENRSDALFTASADPWLDSRLNDRQ